MRCVALRALLNGHLSYEKVIALHVKPSKVEDLHKVEARQHWLVAPIVLQAHPRFHCKGRRVEVIARRDAHVSLGVGAVGVGDARGVEEQSAVGVGGAIRVDSALGEEDDVGGGAWGE